MAFPNITTLPTPPSRGEDSTTFITKANAFLGAFPTLQSDINSWATYAEGTFTDNLNTIKTAAEAARDAAQTAQAEAEAAQAGAETAESNTEALRDEVYGVANYKGLWSSLTGSLSTPASVSHNNAFWLLNTNLVDVTASEPSSTNPDWQLSLDLGKINRLRIFAHAGL